MCCWSCRDSDENVCFSSTQCRCPVERRARLGLIGVEIGDCEFAARHDRIRTTTYLFRDAAPANFGRGFLFYMVGSATSGDEEGTTSRRSINGTAWPSSSAFYRSAATIFKSCTRPASIQWEIVCVMAVRIRPASDELDYSNRSARTGSTRAARRAGIQHAPRATNNNSPATVEMVSGSFAEIP